MNTDLSPYMAAAGAGSMASDPTRLYEFWKVMPMTITLEGKQTNVAPKWSFILYLLDAAVAAARWYPLDVTVVTSFPCPSKKMHALSSDIITFSLPSYKNTAVTVSDIYNLLI